MKKTQPQRNPAPSKNRICFPPCLSELQKFCSTWIRQPQDVPRNLRSFSKHLHWVLCEIFGGTATPKVSKAKIRMRSSPSAHHEEEE